MYNAKGTAKLIVEKRKENSTDIIQFMLKAIHEKMIENSTSIISFTNKELIHLFDMVDNHKIGNVHNFLNKVAEQGNYIYHYQECRAPGSLLADHYIMDYLYVFQIPEEILEEFE